jgi:hypothetical protein
MPTVMRCPKRFVEQPGGAARTGLRNGSSPSHGESAANRFDAEVRDSVRRECVSRCV